jgi:hypothetical protein
MLQALQQILLFVITSPASFSSMFFICSILFKDERDKKVTRNFGFGCLLLAVGYFSLGVANSILPFFLFVLAGLALIFSTLYFEMRGGK